MKSLFLSILVFLLFGPIVYPNVYKQLSSKEPFPLNKGSVYEDTDEAVEVYFFPLAEEESKWDGSKITPKEWILLTDFQKQAFLTECSVKLEKKYSTIIEMNGWDYLVALEMFVKKCNSGICADPPMCEVIEKMLIGDGKLLKE